MRFSHKFDREVGGLGEVPELGSDLVPSDYADLTATNVFRSRSAGERLAVGYVYVGAGTPKELPAKLFFYDSLSDKWLTLEDSLVLSPGDIELVAVPALVGAASSTGGRPYESGLKDMDVALVVAAVDDAAAGTYTFLLGAAEATEEPEGKSFTTRTHLAKQALPAAGAYTDQPFDGVPNRAGKVGFAIEYETTAAVGQVRLQLFWRIGTKDNVRESAVNPAVEAGSSDAFAKMTIKPGEFEGPVLNNQGIAWSMVFDVPPGATGYKLCAAEIGTVGTPGNIEITTTFGSAS